MILKKDKKLKKYNGTKVKIRIKLIVIVHNLVKLGEILF